MAPMRMLALPLALLALLAQVPASSAARGLYVADNTNTTTTTTADAPAPAPADDGATTLPADAFDFDDLDVVNATTLDDDGLGDVNVTLGDPADANVTAVATRGFCFFCSRARVDVHCRCSRGCKNTKIRFIRGTDTSPSNSMCSNGAYNRGQWCYATRSISFDKRWIVHNVDKSGYVYVNSRKYSIGAFSDYLEVRIVCG